MSVEINGSASIGTPTTSTTDPYAGLENVPDILAGPGDLSNRREHRLGLAAAAQVLNDSGLRGLNGGDYTAFDLEREMLPGVTQLRARSIDDVAKAHGIDPATLHDKMASYFANGDGLGLVDPTQAATAAADVAKIVPPAPQTQTSSNPGIPGGPGAPAEAEPVKEKGPPSPSPTTYAGNTGDTFDEKSLDNIPDLLAGRNFDDPNHPSRREHRLSMLAAAQVLNDPKIVGADKGAFTITDLEAAMQANGGQSIDQVVTSWANSHNVDPTMLLSKVHDNMASYFSNGDGMGLDRTTAANLAMWDAQLVPTGAALTAAIPLSAAAASNHVTLPIAA